MTNTAPTTLYPSSNATPIAPAILTLSISLALSILVGALVGTAELYAHTIPAEPLMVTIEILITLAFGTALGALLATVFRKCNSRSKSFNRLCTVAATTAALYTAWIAWITSFIIHFGHNYPLAGFFLPGRMLEIIQSLNRLGTWTLFQKPAHGPLLTCIWFAELFTLATLTTRLVEWKTKRSEPIA